MKKILLLLYPVLIFVSCKNDIETKPVEILYGQDVCERCKMIISEKVYSAEYISLDGEAKKFDDIGCMIHYHHGEEGKGDKILAQYVRDYNTGNWIDATKAYFVRSKDITTPMGYGLVALKNKESAERLSNTVDGIVFPDFEETVKWITIAELNKSK